MRKIIICLVILITITGCENSVTETVITNPVTVTGNEASSLIEDGTLLIDVRTKQEYDEKHITGAINISLADIEAGKINYDKDTAIIVYCKSGNRSAAAAKKLIELGYTSIYDLGSINNFKETE